MNNVTKFAAVHEIKMLQLFQIKTAIVELNNEAINGVGICKIGITRKYYKYRELKKSELELSK